MHPHSCNTFTTIVIFGQTSTGLMDLFYSKVFVVPKHTGDFMTYLYS